MLFSIKCERPQVIVLFVVIILSIVARQVNTNRVRCEKPEYILNGSYRLRRDRIMRVTCNPGFQLQGPKTIDCVGGKWDGERPVCAKKGCQKSLEQPENGQIQILNEVKVILYCSDNYNLAGNRYSYCNGSDWDRPIGNCRVRKNVIQHDCDFETDDICGWTFEPKEGLEWKRVMAANVFTTFKTGPRHDHTTLTANGGHYMLMESLSRQYNPITLTSPIYEREISLKTACCFQFYYFMYGAGVGELLVVIKPVSLTLNELILSRPDLIKFQKNGNQNNIWNENHFNIEELNEDFQIVFVAKSGRGQLSDIAVDDVRLLTGEDCKKLDKKHIDDMSEEEYDTTTYESLYDIQSCAGRCSDSFGNGLVRSSGHLKGLCNCDIDCEDNETCCPDFKIVCLSEIFAELYTNTVVEETTKENIQPFIYSTKVTQPTTTVATSTTSTTHKTTTSTTTQKTTPTTPTTVKTTPTPSPTTTKTVKTTTMIPRTTAMRTTATTPTTTRRIPPTTTIRTTVRTKPTTTTTTVSTTTTTPKTTTTTASVFTTKITTNPQKMSPTQKSIPASKPAQYIIDNSPKSEAAHRGSSLLLCMFIIIVIIILVGAVYSRFGDSAVAWYMIHFKKNSSGDEESSSIITNFKRPESNGEAKKTSVAKSRKKPKKTSYSNDMKNPLVDIDDEDEDDDVDVDVGGNKNITLRNNIFTEL